MKPQELIIDLSGQGGLLDGFAGDKDVITERPERIIHRDKPGMAGGLFNAYRRIGYMSPVVTTTTTVTVPDTLTKSLSVVEYDSINDDIYWSGNTNKIYKQTSLTDISLAEDVALDSGAEINDISVYEIDGTPALVYTYDYPANTTDKKNSVFLGYKSLVSTNIPLVYEYNTIVSGDANMSFQINNGMALKLAQPLEVGLFENSELETIKISDLFLKLRKSTAGQTQTWSMKLSVYSAILSSTADGNSHYVPDTLLGTSIVAASILEDNFRDVQFTLSSELTLTTSHIILVLEPETPGDMTGNEGVEWLSGNTATTSTTNGLYYNGGWYQLTYSNLNSFACSVGLSKSDNILSKEEFSYTTDLYQPEVTSDNYPDGSGNLSRTITVDTLANNLVVVVLTIKTSTDELTGITIGGQAMTLLNNTSPVAGSRTYTYYKFGAPTGSVTIATTGITVANQLVVIQMYGVKSNSITIDSSGVQASSGSPGYFASQALYARRVRVQIASTNWETASGPDYNRIEQRTKAPGASSYSSTHRPGDTGRPLLVEVYNATDSMRGTSLGWCGYIHYDNGNNDGYIDGDFSYLIFTVEPYDSESNEERYWEFSGERSGKAFLRTATNGFCYLFTDRAVHKLDGNATGGGIGLLTPNIITLPNYHTISDAVDYRSRFYIATNAHKIDRNSNPILSTYSGKAGIYVWGRLSSKLGDDDFIELPGVRECRKIYASPDGQLRLITISDDGTTELRQFGYNDSGGVVFPVIKKLGVGAFPKSADGLKVAGDKTIWLGNDGRVYCDMNGDVSIIHEVKTYGTTSSGLINNISGGALFYGSDDETSDSGLRSNKQAITFSYLDGSTHNIKKIYPFDITNGSNTAQAQHRGDVYTAVQLIPITSVVRNLRIYNLPISSTGTEAVATVKVYFNQGTTATHPNGITKTITKNEAKRGYVDFKINNQNIHAIQIEIEWETSINLGDDTYLPSVAIVSYDTTATQSPDNG
jgi:hypothetical protein